MNSAREPVLEPILEPILEIEELAKSFGGLRALQDITFVIGRDEIVGLIGPNGAGKTTLFNCVAGVEKPTTGTISFTPDEDRLNIGGKKPEYVTSVGIARTSSPPAARTSTGPTSRISSWVLAGGI